MSRVAERAGDVSVVSGRSFARTGPDGTIDGRFERGIYAEDVRLVRRVEAYRADPDTPVFGKVTVGDRAATVQFDIPSVEPGAGVMLVVELDGMDLFSVREMVDDSAPQQVLELGLGETRPDARVRMEAWCDGATMFDRDGVARAHAPVRADGSARTASWRWRVDANETEPVDVVVELRLAWALTTREQPDPTKTFAEVEAARRLHVEQWLSERPRVAGNRSIARIFEASLSDLASLRIDTLDGHVLAAGVPWYLTVLGRDSLLSAWMALPADPEIAAATLRHLARNQALEYDLSIDAEPGKILHEERRGVAAARWHERYYGAVDATQLFVMLLAEHARWTGSTQLATELEQPARRAISWICSRVDEDELGLLSFWRRAERGVDIQSWKDSAGSQRDRTGRIATGLIRPLEAQAYGVAALRAGARLATSAWGDDVLASEWGGLARQLERRIVASFLVELLPAQLRGDEDPRSGGYLAMAVDSAGMPVDSLTSNIGHVLWADATADPILRAHIARQLCSAELSSGWGLRTMSTLDAGHDPTSYHCGSVWPHDTAIGIAGMMRVDRDGATQLARNLFDAITALGGHVPERFAGLPRDETPPQRLPASCSPQAWSAASSLLVMRSLLGLEPDPVGQRMVVTTSQVPEWLHGLQWRGVQALGRRWDIVVDRNGVAEIAPEQS